MSKYSKKLYCIKCKQIRKWVTAYISPYCQICKTNYKTLQELERASANALLELALTGEEIAHKKEKRIRQVPHKRNKLVFKRFWRDEWKCEKCGTFNLSKKRWPPLKVNDRYASSLMLICRKPRCHKTHNSNFAGMTYDDLKALNTQC